MVIDANMYWLPESMFEKEEETERFLTEIPLAYGMRGILKTDGTGKTRQIAVEKPEGYQNLNYVQGEYQLKNQIRDMDEGGVDMAILKIPGCHEWMSLDTCRKFNDGMSKAILESNGRMEALTVVPPFASKACFHEIDRCRSMGFKGVQLCAHYGEYYLDAEVFAPFFEKLNETETTVYIHHTPVPVEFDCLYQYNNLRRSYGRCVDQTTAVCRELFSGFFDKYPNLTFVHSMLGGAFFAVFNMMFPEKSEKEAVSRFDEENTAVLENLKKHVYFEMSHAQPWGKDQLECAVKVLGADHILFGTSYPVKKEWLTQGVAFVEGLDIALEEKEAILYGNAKNIYHIDK